MSTAAGTLEHRSHSTVVEAPAQRLYDLVADVTRWPALFTPSVLVDLLEHDEHGERFQLSAVVNGAVNTWTSRRGFDRAGLRISFQQERSQPPIGSMAGRWTFQPLPGGRCKVVLDHEFSAADGDPQTVAVIERALDANSAAELAALRRIAELEPSPARLSYVFEDTVEVIGDAAAAYAFVAAADRWPDLLPHVDCVELREDPPGVQFLEMSTHTADAPGHVTRSIRLCFPAHRIAYKQTTLPPLLLGHSGQWLFEQDGATARLTSRHLALLDPAVAQNWGGLDEARDFVRTALGGNSRITLRAAAARATAAWRAAGRTTDRAAS